MALIATSVGEGLARYVNELPTVGARTEVEPEDTGRAELLAFHVRVVGAALT